MGVTAADYDNDGFADLYLTNLGPDVLYRNNGDGTFTDVTEKAGIGVPGWSSSAAFGDFDGDGFLDLYVARYLDVGPDKLPEERGGGTCPYVGAPVLCGPRGLPGAPDPFFHNNGDGTFKEQTEASGAFDRERYFGLGVVAADVDGDRDLDLYVGNDATPNYLFVNRGDGRFDERGFASGARGERRRQRAGQHGRGRRRLRQRRPARPLRHPLRERLQHALPQPGRAPLRGRDRRARASATRLAS